MDIDISKYIVPIYIDGKFNGNGFIVSHYLVTAGHVIEKNPAFYPCIADIDGWAFRYDPFTMNKSGSFSEFQTKEGQYNDWTIIDIGKDIGSPLRFADIEPTIGQELTCLSFMPDGKQLSFQETLCKVTRLTSSNIIITTDNHTEERKNIVYDTCFECSFDGLLTHGSSGSPVLCDNIVYGILSAGVETKLFDKYYNILTEEEKSQPTNHCLFYKTSLVKHIIE